MSKKAAEGVAGEPVSVFEEDNVSGEPEGKEPQIVVAPRIEGRLSRVLTRLKKIFRKREIGDEPEEAPIKITLRHLIVYGLFLSTLCGLILGTTSSHMYYYTHVMEELFANAPLTRPCKTVTFRSMVTKHDFWQFMDGPLLDGLYWEKTFNGIPVTDDEKGYIYYVNRLLGVPRLRQLRVRSQSCTVPEMFKDQISDCFAEYSDRSEMKSTFGLGNSTAWEYRSAEELGGSSFNGLISTYGGGGYVQDLKLEKNITSVIFTNLQRDGWIDRGTRAVFIDFSMYNPNINLFCIVRLVVEFPPTGGVVTSSRFHSVKLLRYTTTWDYGVMAGEILVVLFIIYYIIEEAMELYMYGWLYVKSVWIILDSLLIMLGISCIVLHIYCLTAVNAGVAAVTSNADQYIDFDTIAFWRTMFNAALAVHLFLLWAKIFKMINFSETMMELSASLSRCAKDLAGYGIMFFVVFFAFTQLGYLLFGAHMSDFRSLGVSMFTLFRIILGDFDFYSLENNNRVLGPIFFILYIFFVVFVFLSMFLAIINDTYAEVRVELADVKGGYGVGEYIKRGYDTMVDKLRAAGEKMDDMEHVLEKAAGKKTNITLADWKQDLLFRGHNQEEVEIVFVKFDKDEDGKLNPDEQKKLQQELENKRTMLKKEAVELEMQHHQGGHGVSRGEFIELVHHIDDMATNVTIMRQFVAVLEEAVGQLLITCRKAGTLDDERYTRLKTMMMQNSIKAKRPAH